MFGESCSWVSTVQCWPGDTWKGVTATERVHVLFGGCYHTADFEARQRGSPPSSVTSKLNGLGLSLTPTLSLSFLLCPTLGKNEQDSRGTVSPQPAEGGTSLHPTTTVRSGRVIPDSEPSAWEQQLGPDHHRLLSAKPSSQERCKPSPAWETETCRGGAGCALSPRLGHQDPGSPQAQP